MTSEFRIQNFEEFPANAFVHITIERKGYFKKKKNNKKV
uniref:Uncharacterized protein n=1 Tax=Anguilla anguilla TaxID=7936 RepID=A0A0E9RHI6_ANGAN